MIPINKVTPGGLGRALSKNDTLRGPLVTAWPVTNIAIVSRSELLVELLERTIPSTDFDSAWKN